MMFRRLPTLVEVEGVPEYVKWIQESHESEECWGTTNP